MVRVLVNYIKILREFFESSEKDGVTEFTSDGSDEE